MITEYNIFSSDRTTVSFDFDGVLHTSTDPGTLDPTELFNWWEWEPAKNIHEILRKEYRSGHKIIIVTSRNEILNWMRRSIMEFVKEYNLPIDELVFTYNLSKKKILLEKKVIRHYDDNINLKYELKNTNIEFVYVYKDKIILTK